MSNPQKPLIQSNIDLRSFEFMPLDVVRLRDSDFAALVNAEAFRAGILLMSASWHQVPAGSLPDDDRILSNLAGFGRVVKEWKKYKDEALHGWVLCEDGRYYHPVVCEKAIESWNSKQEYNYKKFAERLRKANGKLDEQEQVTIPSLDTWISAGMPDSWIKNSQTVELDSKVNSKLIPMESQKKSAVVPQEFQTRSDGIPLENALKGTEHNGQVTDINNISISPPQNSESEKPKADDRFNFDLNTANTKLKLRGLKEITQDELNKLQDDLQAEYGHKNQMVKNQILGKLVQWVERRQQTPLSKTKSMSEKPKQTALNVNEEWKNRPRNDEPFEGKIEIPEGFL